MAKEYVYLLVRPYSSNHPMNNILAVGHYLYEVRNAAANLDLPANEVEVWRMKAGETTKAKLSTWLDKI